jgi:general secretion pathway protein G
MFPRAATVTLGVLLATLVTVVVFAAVRVTRWEGSGKRIRVAADIAALSAGLKFYQMMNGSFPTTDQGLRALVENPTSSPQPAHWRQLIEYIPSDPWNTEYIYRCPGVKNPDGYDLFSAGPDRKPDTADDVWRE